MCLCVLGERLLGGEILINRKDLELCTFFTVKAGNHKECNYSGSFKIQCKTLLVLE